MKMANGLRYDAARKARIEDPEERGEMLDAQGAADFLGVSKGSIRQMTCRKEIPSYKYFKRVVYFTEELKKFRDYIITRN